VNSDTETTRLLAECNAGGFPVEIRPAYGNRLRVTMRHRGRLMQTVDLAHVLKMNLMAMRRALNSENFCPSCGAVRDAGPVDTSLHKKKAGG
jgi:hypothetical protein